MAGIKSKAIQQIKIEDIALSNTVPAVGDNTVGSRLLAAGTSTLWISTNVTKDADSDCSGTIAGTLLLFTFTKKASTVVNFDVDIITSFHSLGKCHFEFAP